MYREHVRELACPSCRGSLAGIDGTGWVDDGSLSCIGCAVEYPIVAGVPRLIDSLPHPTGNSRVDPRTRAAFGFEWLRYPVTTYDEDIVTLVGLTGVEPSFYENVTFNNIFSHIPTPADVAASQSAFFQGKRVVEAGCGMGKYVRVVASLNAELVVGLDASDSVERACQLTRTDRNALIVQGDIFHPPLRGGFDFAYSVGVLHHTSDARKAFLSVANLVSGGGEMSVWLYPHAKSWLPALLEFWHERIARPVTSRLPHEPLEVLCLRLGRLTAMKARLNRRGGGVRRTVARALSVVAVGEHDDPAIGAFLNFDWYSPPFRSRHVEGEVRNWFRDAGFDEPRMLPVDLSAIARKEAGKQSLSDPVLEEPEPNRTIRAR